MEGWFDDRAGDGVDQADGLGGVSIMPMNATAALAQQEVEVPEIMRAALLAISSELDAASFLPADFANPFLGGGTKFECGSFAVEPYSEEAWRRGVPNFTWRDVRVQWFGSLRGPMTANVLVSPTLAAQCLDDCLSSIRSLDPFTEEGES